MHSLFVIYFNNIEYILYNPSISIDLNNNDTCILLVIYFDIYNNLSSLNAHANLIHQQFIIAINDWFSWQTMLYIVERTESIAFSNEKQSLERRLLLLAVEEHWIISVALGINPRLVIRGYDSVKMAVVKPSPRRVDGLWRRVEAGNKVNWRFSLPASLVCFLAFVAQLSISLSLSLFLFFSFFFLEERGFEKVPFYSLLVNECISRYLGIA